MSLRGRRHGGGGQNELLFITNVLVDDQFSSPKQIRWSASLGKLLVANGANGVAIRSADLSFYSKYTNSVTQVACGADTSNCYIAAASTIYKRNLDFSAINNLAIASVRMIDASGDPLHLYVSSNNATDGHGIRMVTKSTMAVTSVGGTEVKILGTGSLANQFNGPLGLIYIPTDADNGKLFVADSGNNRVVELAVVTSPGSESMTWTTTYSASSPYDLTSDGANWYVQNASKTYKYDSSFTNATKVSVDCVGFSITFIPDQGDGNGATLAISNNSGNCLYCRKCSDLSLINTVGSSGDGSSSLFDPVVTGPTGTWRGDDGESHSVASAANISKNGFSGDFFQTMGPHKMVYQATGGLSLITAIDSNTDAITGAIKNLQKCINCTSYKLYGNTAYVINLADISSKATIVQIYSCGAGVIPGDLSKCTAANDIRLQDNSWTTEQVDQFIQWIYAGRAGFTDAARAMRIGANNGAPTGNYTDPTVTPGNGSSNSDWSWNAGLGYHLPLTPNAMVYRLLHAVEAGVSSWSMLATA